VAEPFNVLDANLSFSGVQEPVSHRLCASCRCVSQSATGNNFIPLAIRALMVHRADPGSHERSEVGWGRFEGTSNGSSPVTTTNPWLCIKGHCLSVNTYARSFRCPILQWREW